MAQYRIIKSRAGIYYPQKRWMLVLWKDISLYGFTNTASAQRHIDKYVNGNKEELIYYTPKGAEK